MSDDAKLGLVAGVLAVLAVAVFSSPREPRDLKNTPTIAVGTMNQSMGNAMTAPALPPAAMPAIMPVVK